jgi:hypothetical protein
MPEKNDPGLTGVREYCANTREIVAAPVFLKLFSKGRCLKNLDRTQIR